MNEISEKTDSGNVVPAKKGMMRRLYDWVLHWADTPYGTPALFVISFAESSFFPIPPDVLQVALSAGKPARAFYYATISLIGSVLGAILGYFIGYYVWEMVQGFFFDYLFTKEAFEYVQGLYRDNGFLAVLTAAVTPIPYKIFTIAAGVCELSLVTLLIASVIGRGARFYAVATLLWFFGPSIKAWIEKYFELVATVFLILLIGGFVLMKYLI